MLEVSGIRLSLDAALPENVEMRTKEVARALGVSERDVCSAVMTRKAWMRARGTTFISLLRFASNYRNLRNSVFLKGRQKA